MSGVTCWSQREIPETFSSMQYHHEAHTWIQWHSSPEASQKRNVFVGDHDLRIVQASADACLKVWHLAWFMRSFWAIKVCHSLGEEAEEPAHLSFIASQYISGHLDVKLVTSRFSAQIWLITSTAAATIDGRDAYMSQVYDLAGY